MALAIKMQRMLVDKGVCTTEEFGDKLVAVDREDGKQDGRAPV